MNTNHPDLITEVFRHAVERGGAYDMWAFHKLTPSSDRSCYTFPFAPKYAYELDDSFVPEENLGYKEDGITVKAADDISRYRTELDSLGYVEVDFSELPDNLQYFITHTQAPLEWHAALDDKDPEHMSRIILWVKGELPVENIQEAS